MKLHIACDSTASFTLEEAKQLNIDIIPMSIHVDGKDYKDLYEMNNEMLCDFLKQEALPKTSQPSIGFVEEYIQEWEKQDYDAVLIFTISSGLSGTYVSCKMAAENSKLPIYVIDTHSAATILRHGALEALKLAETGMSIEAIISHIESILKESAVYIMPKNLDQLKRGGRISPLAASASSLLKILPVLYLDYETDKIEKLGISRTQNKAFSMIKDEMDKKGVTPQTHSLAILYVDEKESCMKLHDYITECYPGIHIDLYQIPAVITSHVGLGAFGIQILPLH